MSQSLAYRNRVIVQGAMGMVELARKGLEAHRLLSRDEERKATMVSNLLLERCSNHDAEPVLNAGTTHYN